MRVSVPNTCSVTGVYSSEIKHSQIGVSKGSYIEMNTKADRKHLLNQRTVSLRTHFYLLKRFIYLKELRNEICLQIHSPDVQGCACTQEPGILLGSPMQMAEFQTHGSSSWELGEKQSCPPSASPTSPLGLHTEHVPEIAIGSQEMC